MGKTHRLTFANTHRTPLAFPFASFIDDHHQSDPDIVASFPGQDFKDPLTVTTRHWRDVSLVFDVKRDASEDPFCNPLHRQDSNCHIVKIARNGRNLLLAHGFVASFVIGIYGEYGRFIRFDHTCALVSRRFSVQNNPEILQQFLWHFVHPIVGTTVVGCDPTIYPLEAADRAWVRHWLLRLQEDTESFDQDVLDGRRMEVYDERTGIATPWIVYKALSVGARFFSRATMVWRAIEDTRVPHVDIVGGRVVDPPDAPEPRLRILKESWRQVALQSEASFYHRLAEAIPEEDRIGLTKLECGGDLGQWEVRQWERSSPNVSCMDGYRDLRLSPGPHPPKPRSPSPALSENSLLAEDDRSPGPVPPSPEHFPTPYPQYQTFSWTIARGSEYTYRERSHMRFVVADVGRPLTTANSTRELVTAFRDAITGTLCMHFSRL